MSLQWTADVNQAKRIIADPFQRALYLATGSGSFPEQGTPHPPAAFLEQVFELQMLLMEEPQQALERVHQKKEKLNSELENSFRAFEAGKGSLDRVEEILVCLKYLRNIQP